MTLAFEKHNHAHCKTAHMSQIEEACAARGLRLTDMRKRVLEMLLAQHRAMGAYEILEELAKEGLSAQPPVAYRALAFLTEHGFAHKVERLNAYVACGFPDVAHQAAFMICRSCEKVGESCLENSPLSSDDFEIECQVIEAEGLCKNCKDVS